MPSDRKEWNGLYWERGLKMLSDIGRSNPLVIVFVSLCSGILFWLHDFPALILSVIILSCLISRSRIIHTVIGIY